MSTSIKISVEHYEAMIDRGEFDPIEEHHVELIRGEIVPRFGDNRKTPKSVLQTHLVDELFEWSIGVEPRAALRISIHPIRIPALGSQPQPDLSWLVRKDDSQVHPAPEDVLLLIEVSDSSLGKDRGPKLELYAEAKISDYWIVNIQNRSIDVYRDPQGLNFGRITTFTPGQTVHPLAFPDISLAVSRLFSD